MFDINPGCLWLYRVLYVKDSRFCLQETPFFYFVEVQKKKKTILRIRAAARMRQERNCVRAFVIKRTHFTVSAVGRRAMLYGDIYFVYSNILQFYRKWINTLDANIALWPPHRCRLYSRPVTINYISRSCSLFYVLLIRRSYIAILCIENLLLSLIIVIIFIYVRLKFQSFC